MCSKRKELKKKSFLFVWLIFVNRVRLLHITTHALVSTSSSFPLCDCGGRVLRILQSTSVWCALLVRARRDRHRETERETKTEAAGEEIDRLRVQTDEENRSSCIEMMVAEEN